MCGKDSRERGDRIRLVSLLGVKSAESETTTSLGEQIASSWGADSILLGSLLCILWSFLGPLCSEVESLKQNLKRSGFNKPVLLIVSAAWAHMTWHPQTSAEIMDPKKFDISQKSYVGRRKSLEPGASQRRTWPLRRRSHPVLTACQITLLERLEFRQWRVGDGQRHHLDQTA